MSLHELPLDHVPADDKREVRDAYKLGFLSGAVTVLMPALLFCALVYFS